MLMVPAFCQALKSQLKFGTGKMSGFFFLIEKNVVSKKLLSWWKREKCLYNPFLVYKENF